MAGRGDRIGCFKKSRSESRGAGRKMPAQPGEELSAWGKLTGAEQGNSGDCNLTDFFIYE
jgi:hypothetical protein